MVVFVVFVVFECLWFVEIVYEIEVKYVFEMLCSFILGVLLYDLRMLLVVFVSMVDIVVLGKVLLER